MQSVIIIPWDFIFNHSRGNFEVVKKWVSLGEFTSYDLNNKDEEYLKIMSNIPNFDKREKKRKKPKRRRKK